MTPSMVPTGRAIHRIFCSAVIFASTLLGGCTNFCLVAVSNPGGTVGVTAGNPPPACSLNLANGTVRVLSLKSPTCEACTASSRVEHVFVTLRGIQLYPGAIADSDSPDWVDLIPDLKTEPRQIDLIGGAIPEILAESATVPAGTYGQIRLQFLPESVVVETPADDRSCGVTRANCLVMADGRVEPLHFPGDQPEILISGQSLEGDSLAVLPDSRMDLRLRLQINEVVYSSALARWNPQTELVGTAAATPQPSPE